MSHTPGPWSVVENCIVKTGATFGEWYQLANVPPHERFPANCNTEEGKANLQLMSCAPVLLEKLERVFNSMMENSEQKRLTVAELIEIKQLIARAKGEL